MKLHFLGTMGGHPQKDAHCQSIMLETKNGNYYIFDAGAPLLEIFADKDYDHKKVKGIFITHLHSDHIAGLPPFLAYKPNYGMDFVTFVPEKRAVNAFNSYVDFLTFDNYTPVLNDLRIIEEGVIFANDEIRITAYHTDHLIRTTNLAYGFLIECDGKKIYITGDLDHCCDLPEFLKYEKVDAIIPECGHFKGDLLWQKLDETLVDRVIGIHIWPAYLEVFLEEAKKRPNVDLFVSHDGDIVDF